MSREDLLPQADEESSVDSDEESRQTKKTSSFQPPRPKDPSAQSFIQSFVGASQTSAIVTNDSLAKSITEDRLGADDQKHKENEMGKPWTMSLVIAILQGLLGSFLYGYNASALNVPKNTITDTVNYDLTSNDFDMLTTAYCFGGMVGAICGGPISDRFGRRMTLLANNLIFISGSAALFFLAEGSYIGFLSGRILTGIGGGIATAVVPTYLGEISPYTIRGAVGTLNQLTVCFGIVVTDLLGYHYILGTNKYYLWKFLLAFGAFPCFAQLFLYKWFPESPKWMMQKQVDSQSRAVDAEKENEARKILQWLRECSNVDVDICLIKEAMKGDQSGKNNQNKQHGSDTSKLNPLENATSATVQSNHAVTIEKEPLLRFEEIAENKRMKRVVWKAFVISVVLQILQQLSGINSVFYYSSNTFDSAGLTNSFQQWIAIVLVCLANFIAVFAAVAFMDRLGRRLLLFISLGGMFISSILLTIGLYFKNLSQVWGYLCVVFMVFYVVAFELGLGPIPWLIVSEITPTSHRGKIMSIASAVNWISNLLIAQFANTVVNEAKYIPFATVCALGAIFVAFFVPETKGKSDVEIQNELAK